MTWDSKDSELRIRICARIQSGTITIQQARKLMEFLGCYTYILPAHRCLIPRPYTITTPYNLFNTWLFTDFIYSLLTLSEQESLWTLVQTLELNSSPIHHS